MEIQIQDLIVLLLAAVAAVWLFIRWRKNRSKPCGTCEYCVGINLKDAVKRDEPHTPEAGAPGAGKPSVPEPRSDPQIRK